jgi:hypothetical protein
MERDPNRRGVSLAEIMIVVVLVAFALVPLMNLGQSTHRQAFFTEYHLLAMGRARLVLDLAGAIDFQIYDALVTRAGGPQVEIKMEPLLGPGNLAKLYEASSADFAGQVYQVKLKNVSHDVRFTRLDRDTGRLDVEVKWGYSGDSRGQDHSVRLSRLVTRRELGVRQRYALQ